MPRFGLLAIFSVAVFASHGIWTTFAAANEKAGADKLDVSRLPVAASKKVDYVTDVLPILKKTCYSCHGAEQQEAGLRLDSKKRALEGGDSGAAIVVGKSVESRLIHVIAGIDKEKGRMPPEEGGTPLTAEQIGIIRAWIDQGLVWPADSEIAAESIKHWSFQPIANPAIPAVKNPTWIVNPIDAFILARLEKEQLAPSPRADKVTLMRRIYLDLLGLPPSPAEVDGYLADNEEGAYERLLDRVFASPHYGERWGRHWLDQARYADSDGYEKDKPRPFAWRFRNWVIDAVNADLPFDQFTLQQLAGDMLSDSTLNHKTAVGFHRNTLHNTEGGTDQEEDRVKKTVDRTNTLGTVWMGLTVGCAQCHTHKYDPITQREYFSLYAFFNSISESDIDAPAPSDHARLARQTEQHKNEIAKLEAAVAKYEKEDLKAAFAAWEKSLTNSTAWTTLDIKHAASAKGGKLVKQDDASWLATGKNELNEFYTLEAACSLETITAIRLEVLADHSLPSQGPGRSKNGNFVLSNFIVGATLTGEDESEIAVKLHNAQADYSQGKGFGVATAINDDPQDGWAVSKQTGKSHVAVFELVEPLTLTKNAKLTIRMHHQYKGPDPHNIGRFRLSATSATGPVSLQGAPPEILEIVNSPAEIRTAEQTSKLIDYQRKTDPKLLQLKSAVTDLASKTPKLPADSKVQSIVELPKPRETRIQIRGDFLSPGDVVEPATFSVLPPLKPRNKQPDRVDLAKWLFDPAHPLTARVTVNRIWQHCFGRGLVPSGEDFGKQGDAPSHPELLDWLANTLREQQWSIKAFHRLIITSATYQQSSLPRSELTAVDPENTLVARQSRRRVEAELVRDEVLAASGLIDRRLGGPSVRPPQPGDYSKLTYANGAQWTNSTGGDVYRRGMYTFFQRTSPYPMLMTFDAPDSTETCTRRSQSNTPLQALTLWNDPVFFDAYQAFGLRVVNDVSKEGKETSVAIRDRAAYAFRLCVSRQPTVEELNEVVALFEVQSDYCQKTPSSAVLLLGKKPVPANVAPHELAAWVIVGRTLMNLDEFITRE